jgi:hypothetical protein
MVGTPEVTPPPPRYHLRYHALSRSLSPPPRIDPLRSVRGFPSPPVRPSVPGSASGSASGPSPGPPLVRPRAGPQDRPRATPRYHALSRSLSPPIDPGRNKGYHKGSRVRFGPVAASGRPGQPCARPGGDRSGPPGLAVIGPEAVRRGSGNPPQGQ